MDYSSYRALDIERKGKVLVISFNRAGKANAIDGPIHLELARVFSDIAMDRETEAVLLTGKGGTFSVGGDAEWLSAMTSEQVDVLFVEARKIVMDMLEVPQPIVAAVQGMATGLAATLVVFCDVVFIAEDAQIGDPHVAYALVAGDGGAAVWPLLIGLSRAKELLMTGDIISGKEAARIGLVNHALPDDQVQARALEFANRLANGHSAAIRGTKTAINKILRFTTNLVFDTALALERTCFQSKEFEEAARAIAARRAAGGKQWE
jgi:enoyl-CoA hydratase